MQNLQLMELHRGDWQLSNRIDSCHHVALALPWQAKDEVRSHMDATACNALDSITSALP